MKIINRRRFFRLLGLLALVLIFGVMLSGCGIVTIGGGFFIGGLLGGLLGDIGRIIGAIIGIIGGIILYGYISIAMNSGGSSSSYGSSSSSSSGPYNDFAKLRANGVRKCCSCVEYSSTYGKCKRDDSPKSAEDSCSNWD